MEIRRGEAVGIVGRNGSGKSTLLKMICGTLAATSGELEVNGHIAPILSLGTGFDSNFTGRENVNMNGAVIGFSPAETKSRMGSIEAFANIGDFFDRPVKSYSSGMMARLAFAVAINADPDILVVDEVLAVGDEAFQRKCHSRINDLKNSGSTILFVSHSAGIVVDLCDRAILLEDGERLLTSDPKTVVSWYHKMLYASPEKRAAVCEQISQIEAGGDAADFTSENSDRASTADGSIEVKADQEESEGFFDPDLKSESRVEYEQRGAEILNARILGSDDLPRNILVAGRDYTYAYDVVFHEPAYLVRFGMMLNKVTGQPLGGQASHPEFDGLESAQRGQVAEVRFRFRTLFSPAHYFLNAGVLGVIDGEEAYLHRIIDACVFRIEPLEDLLVTGHVDFSINQAPAQVRLRSLATTESPGAGAREPAVLSSQSGDGDLVGE